MASLLARSLATKTCQMLSRSTQKVAIFRTLSSRTKPVSGMMQKFQPIQQKVTFAGPGCSQLHTDADTSFTEYLEEEIKNNPKESLPEFKGWKLDLDESKVSFSKTVNGEEIKVSMDTNEGGSEDMMPEEEEEQFTEVDDLPPFVVEIKKQTGRTLRLQCVGSSVDEDPEGHAGDDPEEVIDKFFIETVAVHHGEFKENNFVLTRELMSEEMYGNLMTLLDGRGIDNEFVEQLTHFYVAYSNKKYAEFLADLSKFVEEK